MRIEWNLGIETDDGLVLATDVYRPDDDEVHPVILSAGPYAKGLPFQVGYPHQWNRLVTEHGDQLGGSSNKYQAWEHPDPELWVPHSYAVVRVDTRGTGRTPGEVDFFSPRETRDLYQAVEWAGQQPWSNGRVGLLGISYLATNQWQVAELAPPHLAAICPWEGASDFYREYTHSGGIVSEFMPAWMPFQIETVQYGNPDAPENPNNGRRVTGDEDVDKDERRRLAIDIGGMLDEHPFDDEYYRDRSATLERITVPLLSAANWGGMALHSRGNVEGYLRSSSAQKWLEIHGFEHWTEFYTDYGRDLQRRFFDHFLKGADNGFDRHPPVQLKVRHVDHFVERHEHEWPLARTEWTRYYLDAAGSALSTSRPATPQDASSEARSAGRTFVTEVFGEETEITGPVTLKLFVASTTTDADIFATVHLYDPEGTEVLFSSAFEPRAPLTQGWLRVSHRATDPQRSEPWRPWHTHDAMQPLTPGEVYEVDVEVWPTSIVVPPGYRIGLTVQGQDYDHGGERTPAYAREQFGSGPYWHEHPGDRDKPEYSGTTTLVCDDERQPYLVLPVIPAGA
ncbi:MAG: CocE/NonD family hydrolase [Streptosporangiales bacterium]|nr:CocE/NonD family hydrolase [Streptosporangiales bacterium]